MSVCVLKIEEHVAPDLAIAVSPHPYTFMGDHKSELHLYSARKIKAMEVLFYFSDHGIVRPQDQIITPCYEGDLQFIITVLLKPGFDVHYLREEQVMLLRIQYFEDE